MLGSSLCCNSLEVPAVIVLFKSDSWASGYMALKYRFHVHVIKTRQLFLVAGVLKVNIIRSTLV